MRPLSEATARIAGQSFSRKHIALGRIASQWTEIIGPELAERAEPLAINARKLQRRGEMLATLDIGVSSAEATLLHYQKDLILERINRLFGAGWISAIRFVPRPDTGPLTGRKRNKRKISSKNLTEAEKNTLYSLLDTVEDEHVREGLNRLGQHILMEEQK